jgi:acetylornithine deacetylase/succinyl-diaminopimelate desuccinylase-like protein
LLPEVEEYFTKISVSENGDLKKAYEDIKNAVNDKQKEPLLLSDMLKSSMLRNTISLTRMEAGYKTNVIPAKAMAQLDCRLLPDVKKDEFVAYITKLVDDPEVEVKIIDWQSNEPSKLQTELYEAIKTVAKEENPNIPVVPVIVPWFTDSHWMRELGMTAYGFQPIEVDKLHLATMHGKDERLPIKSLENGVRRMHKILVEFCSAK